MNCFNNASTNSVHSGAVKHSDAIVAGCDKAMELVKNALDGKPSIHHKDGEDLGELYEQLYDQILA
jgi:hypothetical protein